MALEKTNPPLTSTAQVKYTDDRRSVVVTTKASAPGGARTGALAHAGRWALVLGGLGRSACRLLVTLPAWSLPSDRLALRLPPMRRRKQRRWGCPLTPTCLTTWWSMGE